MVYTVTFNPSVDYIVSVNDFELGMTNRTASELILPGGKGINVSIVRIYPAEHSTGIHGRFYRRRDCANVGTGRSSVGFHQT